MLYLKTLTCSCVVITHKTQLDFICENCHTDNCFVHDSVLLDVGSLYVTLDNFLRVPIRSRQVFTIQLLSGIV